MVYLLKIAGQVALLLWGTHMVTSGLLRGFGHRLQPWLERHLNGRFSAFLAGLGLTALLQSSTATGLMSASFAARGIMTLATGLAIMLGANIGTALVAQVLSFDVAAFAPILILLGYVGFRNNHNQWRQWGRAGIGLGLMLLALHGLMETLTPLEQNDTFRTIVGALNEVPWLLMILAILITWMCHSSVAVVLFTASIAQIGLVEHVGLLAMVLGANIGGAIPPILETTSTLGKRIPMGNALTRVIGVILCWPLLGVIAKMASSDPRLVVDFHLGFNVALTIIAMPLLPLMGKFVERLLPLIKEDDASVPLYLDPTLTINPDRALTATTREVLRMSELADGMFKGLHSSQKLLDKEASEKLDFCIDKLGMEVRHFLSHLDDENISNAQKIHLETLRTFTLQMGHMTDILLVQREHVNDIREKGIVWSDSELQDLTRLYDEIKESWQAMITLLMNPNEELATVLQQRKTLFRVLEEDAEHRFAMRTGSQAMSETVARQGAIFLQLLRNLRRLHSHIVSCSYPVLDHMNTEALAEEPQGS